MIRKKRIVPFLLLGISITESLLYFISLAYIIPEELAYILSGIAFILIFVAIANGDWVFRQTRRIVIASLLLISWGVFSTLLPFWNSKAFHLLTNKPLPFTCSLETRISKKDAFSDVSFAMERIVKIHPKTILEGKHLKKEVLSRFNETYSQMDSITVAELNRFLQKQISPIHDAHTVAFYRRPSRRYLPQSISLDDVVQINGEMIDSFIEKKRDLYSIEKPILIKDKVLQDLRTSDGSLYLGLDLLSGIRYSCLTGEGSFKDIQLTLEDFVSSHSTPSTFINNSSFISYNVQSGGDYAIIHVDACSYYTKEQKKYVNEMFSSFFTSLTKSGIENVILDLRKNNGGSPELALNFIRYLDTKEFNIRSSRMRLGRKMITTGRTHIINRTHKNKVFSGNLFVLTSSKTFSAALDFANYLQDNKLGLVVGESPDNSLNGYGNICLFILPKSGLFLSVSCAKYARADKSITSDFLMPDYPCPANAAEQKVLEIIHSR